jgi:hypothetical protein
MERLPEGEKEANGGRLRRRQSIVPIPTVWLRTAGEAFCRVSRLALAQRPQLEPIAAYPQGVCSGVWSKVSGILETRHERR